MVMVEINAPGKGLPAPADHTGSPGNILVLFFVHGKSLPMFLVWLKQGSAVKYMKEALTLLFSGGSHEH